MENENKKERCGAMGHPKEQEQGLDHLKGELSKQKYVPVTNPSGRRIREEEEEEMEKRGNSHGSRK